MKFITFSGVDGSGKSTQLSLLREKLERDNHNVAYFHAIEFSIASRFKKQLTANKKQEADKAITKASWCGILLRKLFLIIDILRFRCLLRKLRKENCDYLLSDRYFYDTIINLKYLSLCHSERVCEPKNLETKTRSLDKLGMTFLERHILKPNTAFYFDISPETIMSRERAPEQGIEYLRAKQELFNQKLTLWNMTTIDANRDKETIFQEILTIAS